MIKSILIPEHSAKYLHAEVQKLAFKSKDQKDTVLHHLNYLAADTLKCDSEQFNTPEFILKQKELFKNDMSETFYDLTDHPSSPNEFKDPETNNHWIGWLDHATLIKNQKGVFLAHEKAKEIINALIDAESFLSSYGGTNPHTELKDTLDQLSDELHAMLQEQV